MIFRSICPVDGPDQALSIVGPVDPFEDGTFDVDPLWQRVAVCSMWQNADVVRKRWPHAAVVAPCRTLLGIDYLLRDLLANPQIRILVIDGVDLSPGKITAKTLDRLWAPRDGDIDSLPLDTPLLRKQEPPDSGRKLGPGDPVFEALCLLLYGTRAPGDAPGVQMIGSLKERWNAADCTLDTIKSRCPEALWNTDRRGGEIILPPPPPKAEAAAPPGDPGERVVGSTLDIVYAGVLRAAMSFGREVETQYGATREMLNLVSVIRHPELSLEEGWPTDGSPHPVLGFTGQQLHDYTYSETGFLGTRKPENASYGYGQRLRGVGDFANDHAGASTSQIDEITKLLQKTPGTRAAYLSAWWPDEDAGLESGRPCLVGAWFRAVPESFPVLPTHDGFWRVVGGRVDAEFLTEKEAQDFVARPRVLHLTVAFRSHDLLGGYGNNLGACCLWLIDTAASLGMQVGTVTCVSYSAHVYKKDWDRALEIAKFRGKGISWDQRSTWRVEKVAGKCSRCDNQSVVDSASITDADVAQWVADKRVPWTDTPSADAWRASIASTMMHDRVLCPRCYGWDDPAIRAVALTPDGNKVLDTFEGPTAASVAHKIEQSGLITSVGNALWLGGELAKLEAQLEARTR